MAAKTIVPAQPGWFVVSTYGVGEEDERLVEKDPIIAWEIEVLPDHYQSGPVYVPRPVVLGMYHAGLYGILKPDGSVWTDLSTDYANLDDFIKDAHRRHEEWMEQFVVKEPIEA